MFTLRRVILIFASLLVLLPFVFQSVTMTRAGQEAGTANLTNDDVIKMVQAKLPEGVIVAKIKSSPCRFDTSTDALIKLKQAGISDAVMQAMTEAGAPPRVANSPGATPMGPPPQSSSKVFVAGTGNPDRLPDVLDGLTGCLADKGVTVNPLGAAPMSRGVALEEMKQKGGSRLVFTSLDFAPGVNMRAHLTVQSFDENGKPLWEEKVNGSMMVTSQSGYIRKMVNNVCKKLDAHIGGEDLPKDARK